MDPRQASDSYTEAVLLIYDTLLPHVRGAFCPTAQECSVLSGAPDRRGEDPYIGFLEFGPQDCL